MVNLKLSASNLQVYWHESKPIYSLRFSNFYKDNEYILYTAGGDNKIRQWKIILSDKKVENGNEAIDVEISHLNEIGEHSQAVNVVRSSPLFIDPRDLQNNVGKIELLASAGDDGGLTVWSIKNPFEVKDTTIIDDNTNSNSNSNGVEQLWRQNVRSLNSNMNMSNELYDISWSPEGSKIAVAGMDGYIYIYKSSNGQSIGSNQQNNDNDNGSNRCVQGLAWDPNDKYLVSQNVNRSINILNLQKKNHNNDDHGVELTEKNYIVKNPINKKQYLFHNDTLVSFFRRPSWSPCGSLIAFPAGLYDNINSVLIFTHENISRPSVALPNLQRPAIAVSWSPILYKLNSKDESSQNQAWVKLPYKLLLAIATTNQVIIYDTESLEPLTIVSNLHYTPVTDICWSPDGRLVMCSSTDGFCSYIHIDSSSKYLIPLDDDELKKSVLPNQNQCPIVPIVDSTETKQQVNILSVRRK